jgi:RimJ/RimL family protein N-acetyltransferase
MNTTPEIITQNLVLRPFADVHLTERYVAWLNDLDVVRFSELRHRHHDAASCREHLIDLRNAGHFFWAIELRETPHTHIGNVTAYRDPPNDAAEVSILLGDRSARRKSLGSEAWCAVIDHLIDQMGIRMVHAGTMAVNIAMLRLFEKSGLCIQGRLPGRFLVENEPVDLVLACRRADTRVEPVS